MNVPAADAPVDRAARLLALLLERSPRPPAELASAIGAGGNEIGGLVAALERHGLVQWTPDRAALRPGPRPMSFARSGLARQDLVDQAAPALRRLADESGETANLMVPTPGGSEAIAQEDGRHLLGLANWVGRQLPDHASAAGKVFLAWGAAPAPARPQALTARTIVDPRALAREADAVRARGYATLVDELEPGLSAVGAPVFDAGGGVVAALTVSGPTQRLPEHRLKLLGRVAVEQAHGVSASLGYDGALEDVLG
jgi:IclR family transcriptional regulator, acetate operon repressor